MIAGDRLGYEETHVSSCYLKMMVLREKNPHFFLCVWSNNWSFPAI